MKQATGIKLENGHDEFLSGVDINIAIEYFGSTELLDNIGFSTIANYLKTCRGDRLYKDANRSVIHLQSEEHLPKPSTC